MSVQEMIAEAQTLSFNERKQLVKALVDLLVESPQTKPTPQRSLREFRGLGAVLYDGTDAQVYVNQLRGEWGKLP